MDNNSTSIAEELRSYISQRKFSVIFVWIYTILIYGAWCAQNLVTFDAEAFYETAAGQGWYNSWYQLGRWSLVLFKDIFNVKLVNPYFQITLFGLLFPASVILWWFCFYRWNKGTESKFGLLFFAGIYLSHPIWALQFSYRNQMESIVFLMCLLPMALLLLTDRTPKERIIRIVISAVMVVFCFGGYQSFLFMYGEGIILYLLFRLYHDYSKGQKKDFWMEVLFLSIYTGICFGACSVISRLICKRHGLEYGTSYLNDQFHWGKFPIRENLHTICEYLKNSMISNGVIYNCLGIIELVLGIVLVIFLLRKKPHGKVLGLLMYLASWIVPFALLFVTASPLAHRSQFCFVLALAFWSAVELGALVHLLSKKHLTDATVVLMGLVLMFTMFPQIQSNTRLLYSEYMTMHMDEVQLWHIYYQALAKGAHEGDAIVFVHGKGNYMNESMLEEEVIGFSYFEFNMYYGGTKIIEAMRAYGMNVSSPTDEQRAYAESIAANMDIWPSDGGIVAQDGIIIVNM